MNVRPSRRLWLADLRKWPRAVAPPSSSTGKTPRASRQTGLRSVGLPDGLPAVALLVPSIAYVRGQKYPCSSICPPLADWWLAAFVHA